VVLPDAILFLRISRVGVFNSHSYYTDYALFAAIFGSMSVNEMLRQLRATRPVSGLQTADLYLLRYVVLVSFRAPAI
jgi:hypothetical protein